MFGVASCNLWRLYQQDILIKVLKNIFTGSNMEILNYEILHNSYCQQHKHVAVLSLLDHFNYELFLSHVI